MRFVLNPEAMAGLFAEGAVGDKALAIKAEMIATDAKRLCPVDTGRLMGSINVVHGHDAKGPVALVGTNVSYSLYVEMGTRYIAAQPFLRPAAHITGDVVVSEDIHTE